MTVATHVGYGTFFIFFATQCIGASTPYSSGYSNSKDGTGASYVGRLHVIIMLVIFTMNQIKGTLLIINPVSWAIGIGSHYDSSNQRILHEKQEKKADSEA